MSINNGLTQNFFILSPFLLVDSEVAKFDSLVNCLGFFSDLSLESNLIEGIFLDIV